MMEGSGDRTEKGVGEGGELQLAAKDGFHRVFFWGGVGEGGRVQSPGSFPARSVQREGENP